MIKIESLMKKGPTMAPKLPFTGGTMAAPSLPEMCCHGTTKDSKMKNMERSHKTMATMNKMTGKSKY